MNGRLQLFAVGILAGIICLILTVLYWVGGTGLGHHVKHGILFLALAIVAFVFAAVMRPFGRTV